MGNCVPTMGGRKPLPTPASVVMLGRPGAGSTTLLLALTGAAERAGGGKGGGGGDGGGGGGGGGGFWPSRGGHGKDAVAEAAGVTVRRVAVGDQALDLMDVGELDRMYELFRKNGLSATAVIYTLNAGDPSTFAAAATDLRRLFIGDRAAKTTIFPDVPLLLLINRVPAGGGGGGHPPPTGEFVQRLRVDDLPVRALHVVAVDATVGGEPGVPRALALLAAEVRRARASSLVM